MARKIKSYVGHRSLAGRISVLVEVHDAETNERSTYPLPHLMYHSPDGFEWGYGGSGPSDLARSIVGDLLGVEKPAPRVYQHVKAKLIAQLPRRGWRLDQWNIEEVMAEV